MTLSLADLFFVKDQSRKYYINTPNPSRLEGMDRDLTEGELIVVSYFEAAVDLLAKRGLLVGDWYKDDRVNLFCTDSNPVTDDYE